MSPLNLKDDYLDGVLYVLKPPGMTSHDVVALLRSMTGSRRVGHAGTLDPDACGVLPICFGRATRLSEYMMDAVKKYRAEMVIGMSTSTGDSAGEVLARMDASHITADRFQAAAARFTGEIWQRPPAFSAIKLMGKPLYEYARRGEKVEVPARKVNVRYIRMIRFWPGGNPRVLMEIFCSKGTYIRSLCSDMGDWMGCGAHVRFLLRTEAAGVSVGECCTIEEIEQAIREGRLGEIVRPMARAVPWFPSLSVTPKEAAEIRNGRVLERDDLSCDPALVPGTMIRIVDGDGQLLAMGELTFGGAGQMQVRMRKVFVRDG